jgi:hypothetical protein
MCRADQARIVELVKEVAQLRAENKRLEAESDEIIHAALLESRELYQKLKEVHGG